MAEVRVEGGWNDQGSRHGSDLVDKKRAGIIVVAEPLRLGLESWYKVKVITRAQSYKVWAFGRLGWKSMRN